MVHFVVTCRIERRSRSTISATADPAHGPPATRRVEVPEIPGAPLTTFPLFCPRSFQ
ncbi:MAG: hypothetical protein Ct9H300mP1_38220 [Planctomycetaceae bacterium]|nr:MAG: hypothetical protein Ct9H300mP1_38220 [Planctomycetaceae bacterium]